MSAYQVVVIKQAHSRPPLPLQTNHLFNSTVVTNPCQPKGFCAEQHWHIHTHYILWYNCKFFALKTMFSQPYIDDSANHRKGAISHGDKKTTTTHWPHWIEIVIIKLAVVLNGELTGMLHTWIYITYRNAARTQLIFLIGKSVLFYVWTQTAHAREKNGRNDICLFKFACYAHSS